jgi:hypothetical protein
MSTVGRVGSADVEIVAALFVEGIEMRQVPGPSTRIDLTGVMFSAAAPSPPPITLAPHLVVLVREAPDGPGQASLVCEFVRQEDGEQVARNVQFVEVAPGKFGRQLVKAELEFTGYGTIEARCRLNADGHVTTVPFTLLPAAA